jgi:catechol 2,3-dioxygenase-like lactoylglutathione lyase family enzyme
MPTGAEAERAAEDFYGGILGLELRDKPPALAARGGRWFDNGRLKVHLGADPAFRPSDKAHVALVVEGLDHLVDLLAEAGHTIRWDTEVPGVRRCYTTDPFGNRIELIEASR